MRASWPTLPGLYRKPVAPASVCMVPPPPLEILEKSHIPMLPPCRRLCSTGPLVITVPPVNNTGYWLISFYDSYLAEYAVVGTRNTGNGGGKWLLTPPGYTGDTYGFDADYIIEAPTNQSVLLGRIGEWCS